MASRATAFARRQAARSNFADVRPRTRLRTRQSGVALIIVLMVTALVTILAATMLARQHLAIARTQQLADISQARAYALGAEEYARELLLQDLKEDRQLPHTDKLSDIWAKPKAPFAVDCGALQLQVRDAKSRFNVNALVLGGTNPAAARVRQLLSGIGLDPALTDAIKDWVDGDNEVSGFGAEDGEYLLRVPPYRPGNALIADVSELALVGNSNPETQARLQESVVTLPTANGQINVNTATAAGYLALAPQMSLGEAEAITQVEREFRDPAQFINEYPAFGPAIDGIAVSSDYFQVNVRVDCHDATVHLESLIYRDPSAQHTQVLSRNFGRRWFTSAAPVKVDQQSADNAR